MMLEALGVREAHAPLAGRRDAVGLVWLGRHRHSPRPRSAVTVSANAPGLAPLTGFSRSSIGADNRSARLAVRIATTPLRAAGALRLCDIVSREGRGIAIHSTLVASAGGGGLFMSSPGATARGPEALCRCFPPSVSRGRRG